MSDQAEVQTFVSRTANSTTILPSGKVITFSGPRGGEGAYATSDPEELAWLNTLADSKFSMVRRQDRVKISDPTVADLNQKVLESALVAADPKLEAVANAALSKNQQNLVIPAPETPAATISSSGGDVSATAAAILAAAATTK